LKIDLKTNYEALKPHSKKPVVISHHLAVLVGHDTTEL